MELEIARILRALRRGDVIVTKHARIRMLERNIELDDIFNLGIVKVETHRQENGSYKIVGLDLDFEPLTVIATYEFGAVIITVY